MTAAAEKGTDQGHRSIPIRVLLLGAAAGLLLYMVLSVVALARLAPRAQALNERGEDLTTVSAAIQALDSSLTALANEFVAAAAEVERSGPPAAARDLEAVRLGLRAVFDSSFGVQGKLFGTIPDSARVALARAAAAERDAALTMLDAEIRLAIGDVVGARRNVQVAGMHQRDAHRQLDALARAIVTDLAQREAAYAGESARALRFTIWWALLGSALVVALSVLAYRRLYQPLGVLTRGLRELEAGNFQLRLPVQRDDELGRLQAHLNSVAEALGARASAEAQYTWTLSERLGRVLDEGSNEIYIFDAITWRLHVTSRAARRNLGYSAGELSAMTLLELLPEYTRERFAGVLETVRSGIQPRAFLSTVLRRADGSTYPVEMTLQYSEAEQPAVFHAAVEDISERTRVEAERDLVFDRSADLMAIGSTGTQRLVRVNPAMAAVLGRPERELVGTPFLDLVHPDDQPLARRQMEQLGKQIPMRGTAVRMRTADGGHRWVSWNIEPPRDGLVYAIGRDITDRRRAESRQAELQVAVARSAREWRMTFDALEDPVAIVNEAGQIVRVNEAARRLSGQPHADVLGRELDVLEPPGLWRRAGELVAQVRADGLPASAQLPAGPDGRAWDLQVHPVTGAAAGQMAAIIIAHDVTAVVRLQDSVRRHEAMAAMGALVAGVAHEVRNPLFSMTATLDAYEARLSAEQVGQRHIRVLRTQLDRLQQLMRELLEYGKPPQLSLSMVGIDVVASQATDECSLLAHDRGVTLDVEIRPGLPCIRADRARLTQVYVNLLTNAMHHAPDGTRVTLRAREVCQDGAAWLETAVEDAGEGFRPDDLPRIFEPFFSRRPGGTGLGLALVQRIVEQHGGTVVAANRPHGGAVVMVRLPLAAD